MTIIAPLTGVNAGLNEALVYRKTIVKSKITHSKKKLHSQRIFMVLHFFVF
jgi:hypothetical protein